MPRKPPRRTAERILVATLALFNRYGEPNTSTAAISSELGISPGNLYYHYPSKDDLVNTLFDQYQGKLSRLLAASGDVQDVEDAWFLLHTLFELIWDYRFLYRDLSHLLSRNRHLELQFPPLLDGTRAALQAMLTQLNGNAAPDQGGATTLEAAAANMVVVLTYWLSYEYALDPRNALEPDNAQNALMRGAWHAMRLALPHVPIPTRTHLEQLLQAYQGGLPR